MNAETKQSVHFKKLTAEERISKIIQLAKSKENKIVVWLKGTEEKVPLQAIDFIKERNEIEIAGDIPDSYINQNLLVSFEISGLHFFGACEIKSATKEMFFLSVLGDLFKSERRLNFRLLTYPHQDVSLHVKVAQDEEEASNLISMRTGISETQLFHNFLNLVEEDDPKANLEGFIKLRVLDISVTGLALQLGAVESELFEQIEENLGLMYLEFNDEVIRIPNGEILYKMDFLAPDKRTKLVKAGVRFKDVDVNLDEKLAGLINQTLRSLESEFEDFIK